MNINDRYIGGIRWPDSESKYMILAYMPVRDLIGAARNKFASLYGVTGDYGPHGSGVKLEAVCKERGLSAYTWVVGNSDSRGDDFPPPEIAQDMDKVIAWVKLVHTNVLTACTTESLSTYAEDATLFYEFIANEGGFI